MKRRSAAIAAGVTLLMLMWLSSLTGPGEDAKRQAAVAARLGLYTPHPFPQDIKSLAVTQITTASMHPFKMTTFSSNDILSDYVRTHLMWDRAKSKAFEKMTANTGTLRCLDVGANLGWFSLLAASLGHTVVAFEPFASNVALFEQSIRDNPGFNELITLYPLALSNKETTCRCVSEQRNVGDCHNMCDGDADDYGKLTNNNDKYKYEVRGLMKAVALDRFAPEFQGFFDWVKIDVEGYELPAVMGAQETLFGNNKVPFVETEFAPQMMANLGFDAEEYLLFFHERGYHIFHDGTELPNSVAARSAFTAQHRMHILDLDVMIPERVEGWFAGVGSKYHLQRES